MGNDGGSIPGRKDLVRERPKEIKIDQEITAKAKAKFCTLTKQKLQKPIVACRLGFLFNKEPLLKALIEKSLPKQFDHITSLKDITTVNVMDNDKKDAEFSFMCPATRVEFNGLNKFVFIWTCGCMFSEKVLQETKSSNSGTNKPLCLVCNKPYHKDDVVSLNMTPEQQAVIKKSLMEQKELHQKKKAQKSMKEDGKGKPEDKTKEQEPDPSKKIKANPSFGQLNTNILDKIVDTEFMTVKTIENNSNVFKSLFHKEHKLAANLFFNNVRHGLR